MKNEAMKIAPAAVLAGAAALMSPSGSSAQVNLFSEDFENLTPVLRQFVDETPARTGNRTQPWVGQGVWTHFMPLGWTRDDSGVPGQGAREWAGWSFANKDFWIAAANNQNRIQYTRGQNIVAIADPDEYDDYRGGIPGNAYYNVYMTTPDIYIGAVAPASLRLIFDSSWRPEGFDDGSPQDNNQTAIIRASYDGGQTWTEILRWDSDVFSDFFKPDATNENVSLVLNPPSGATTVRFEFALILARNDWWWAIDNLRVTGNPVANARSISGTVTRADASGPFDARFVLTPTDGSGAITVFGKVAANGSFTVPAVPNKNYQVRVKAGNTLSRVVNANATAGNVTGLTIAPLLGGDANDDDSVDLFDLAALIETFDADVNTDTYRPGPDFNADGIVDLLDLAILIGNFDQSGE
ncbi:MAG: hypothetical protein RMJ43_04150 [Chloroherpetonaceae bacterium]|nr:hypothetical protein [Chthonomonadaceae bacterium]MDW8207004.1 hypothetical protein [Chloroherpetonaceae bacterium]